MSRIVWQDVFLTGIDTIDNQHRKLVEIINTLDSEFESGAGDSVVDLAISTLIAYADEHFETEQDFMKAIEYPAYDDHKRLHDRIRIELGEMARRVREKGDLTASGLLSFLANWLLDHIMEEDGKFGKYSRQQSANV